MNSFVCVSSDSYNLRAFILLFSKVLQPKNYAKLILHTNHKAYIVRNYAVNKNVEVVQHQAHI